MQIKSGHVLFQLKNQGGQAEDRSAQLKASIIAVAELRDVKILTTKIKASSQSSHAPSSDQS